MIKNLAIPGLDLRLVLGRVRDEVLKSTGSAQEPFVYGSLGGAEISLSREIRPETLRVPTPVAPLQREAASAQPTPPAENVPTGKAAHAAARPVPEFPELGEIKTFDQPIPFSEAALKGRSLKQLLTEVPSMHSPIVGLPDEVWKQDCSTCHNWDQPKLCEQGKGYVKAPEAISRHQHPFGSAFKVAVMKWARDGCK